MTSKLDSMPKFVETDSAPTTFSTPPVANPSRMAPAATFAMPRDRRGTTGEFSNVRLCSPFMQNQWKHPQFANFDARFASFRDWPKYLRGPSKIDLARAGFIYTDIGDRVTCFSCGWNLSDWEPFDNAYKEHLRWSRTVSMLTWFQTDWIIETERYLVTHYGQMANRFLKGEQKKKT